MSESIYRIKNSDICLATRHLATLLRAGMPLVPALAALVEQLQGEPLAKIMLDAHDQVNAGASFAQTLEKYPQVFSPLFINMVKAGQVSGTLEEVLLKLAHILEKRAQLTGKVKTALIYPLFMAIAAVGVIIFLMAFVIPSISAIFLDMQRQLPWPTTMLINISNFMSSWLLPMVVACCLIAFAVRFYLKTESGKMAWDCRKLKLPMIGPLLLKVETSRFTRTLGIMLNSGINILQALGIVKDVIQNVFIAQKIKFMADDISKGKTVAQAVRQTNLFPPITYHTIAIGELSGNLEEQLSQIADLCDEQIDQQAKSLTALLEPAILLTMGILVGFIVLALLLPIFEINQML